MTREEDKKQYVPQGRSGESYPGEFDAMEHNGRLDALKNESWESDTCDGCYGANSKWNGENYPGEFDAMEHNGRLDALESEDKE